MKKCISVLLLLVLTLNCLFPVYADSNNDYDDLPVIFVPGFSSSQLIMENDDGTEEKVWMFYGDSVREKTENVEMIDFIIGFLLLPFRYTSKVEQASKPAIDVVAGTLATDAGGNSINNIRPAIEPTADAARYSTLTDDNKVFTDFPQDILDYDNVFVLGVDFRLDILHNVDLLEKLIDSVLEDTGKEKVNILCQSYGGQVTGTYLSKHANDPVQKVHNVMMTCPALGGAALAYDFLTGNMVFDEEGIAEFVEYMSDIEPDYHLLLDSDPLKIIDDFVKAVYDDVYIHVGTWPSFWDFVPYDYYKDLINEKLDPVENAELIEKTTFFHETYMKNFGENLRKSQKNGVNISILAGTGIASLTGWKVNSDGIIPVSCTTGATPAPLGYRYNDGYNTLNTVCNNPDHYHLSPSMEVDASTCFLPENTWFIQNYFHGQEMAEAFTKALCIRQLLSIEPLEDVYASSEFPQFHTAASRSQGIHASFNHSNEGYISDSDDHLTVTNTSSSKMYITDIKAEGACLRFDYIDTIIEPGAKADILFTGNVPETSLTTMKVTISYVLLAAGNITPAGSREFTFTIKNGEAPDYDASTPYIETKSFSPTVSAAKGITESLRIIKRLILRIMSLFSKIFGVFGQ